MHLARKLVLVHTFLGVVCLATLLPIDEGMAATYYVDPSHANASDANPGTSESAPWLTLQRAGQADVVAGDTVYVKNGTYNDSERTSDGTPSFNPQNSGTASAPIAFRAYAPLSGPRHTPVVTRTTNTLTPGYRNTWDNAPVIGSNGRNYIIWDGFTLGPGTDVRVENCAGCIVENLIIDKGPGSPTNGNYNGMFIQTSTNIVIRNNIIRNVLWADGGNFHNAAAIVLYSNTNVHIHNNEIYNAATGIFSKEGERNDILELNYIHDVNSEGVLFNGQVQVSRCGACLVQFNHVRQNVFFRMPRGISSLLADNGSSDIYIYNNTLYGNNSDTGFLVIEGVEYTNNIPGVRQYNNIIYLINAAGSIYDYWWYGSVAPNTATLLSNYSNFYASSQFRLPGGARETLLQWQSRGFDLNSLTIDPQFVGPFAGTPPPSAFNLSASSPLRNAGRVGGVSTGAAVNMGAYMSDTDMIGVGGSVDRIAPSLPTNLTIGTVFR